jgi:hypothetical protein
MLRGGDAKEGRRRPRWRACCPIKASALRGRHDAPRTLPASITQSQELAPQNNAVSGLSVIADNAAR